MTKVFVGDLSSLCSVGDVENLLDMWNCDRHSPDTAETAVNTLYGRMLRGRALR